MTAYDYDLFVIGAGSGGVRAARIAAQHGARVAIAEEYKVGGTCVTRGCVPKKLLVYGAHVEHALHDAKGYGWTIDGARFDWPTLRDAVQNEVTRLSGLYVQNLEKAGVEIIHTRAVFEDAHTIDLGDRRVTAKYILIAAGARPALPDCPGQELGITSNEAFELEKLPSSIVIAGAGYISLEFANIFHSLGVDVTIVNRSPRILGEWDREMRDRLQEIYSARGIRFHLGAIFTAIHERLGGGVRIDLSDGSVLEAGQVMYAIGRRPKVEGLNLDLAGVELDERGAIKVDRDSRTSAEDIFAVGDIIDRIQLTPVAIKQGHSLADRLFGNTPWHADLDHVASAVFSAPPIAAVGKTEDELAAAGIDYTVHRSDFRPMKNVLAGRNERSLVKLLAEKATGRVLGAHMIGEDAPEIMQLMATVVKLGGTMADLKATVAIHPTSAEEFVLLG